MVITCSTGVFNHRIWLFPFQFDLSKINTRFAFHFKYPNTLVLFLHIRTCFGKCVRKTFLAVTPQVLISVICVCVLFHSNHFINTC